MGKLGCGAEAPCRRLSRLIAYVALRDPCRIYRGRSRRPLFAHCAGGQVALEKFRHVGEGQPCTPIPCVCPTVCSTDQWLHCAANPVSLGGVSHGECVSFYTWHDQGGDTPPFLTSTTATITPRSEDRSSYATWDNFHALGSQVDILTPRNWLTELRWEWCLRS